MDQFEQIQKKDDTNQLIRCKFFNKGKSRKCNIEVYKPGYEFCVFHLPEDLKNQEYVDCTIDPTHQVLKSRLNRHEKICNKLKDQKKTEQNPFFQQGVNSQIPVVIKEKNTQRLQELFYNKSLVLKTFIESVPEYFMMAIQLYQENQTGAQKDQQFISNSKSYLLDEDFNNQTNHSDNEKDLLQVELLVQTIKNQNLLNNTLCYIEYGAGKGRLSHGIAQALIQDFGRDNACHVLIEREARRLKFDRLKLLLYKRFHRDNPYFLRLRMDITDFKLATLRNQLPPSYFEKSEDLNYVGVCKHMCGGATDLTIKSLISSNTQNDHFIGFVCATCCHHLCDRKTYVNVPFLTSLGMSDEQIDLLFACSSWGVSGQVQKKVKLSDQQPEDFFSQLSTQTRTQVGKMAKRIIDIGRLLHITTNLVNLEGSLIKYCESQLSPENFVLAIVQRQQQK